MARPAARKQTNPGSLYSFSLVFISALLSLVASFVLSVESIHVAKNADAVLSCDITETISCGTVARHDTAEVFGFPNAFIGMVAMPVFVTLAVLVLSGAKLPKWVLRGAWWGASAALIFAGWMFYTSYFVIGVLCPWCLVVSFSSVAMWFALTRFVIIHQQTMLPDRLENWLRGIVKYNYDKLAMWLVVVAMVVAIIIKYL